MSVNRKARSGSTAVGARQTSGRRAGALILATMTAVPLGPIGQLSVGQAALSAFMLGKDGYSHLRRFRTPMMLFLCSAGGYLLSSAVNSSAVAWNSLALAISLAIYVGAFAAVTRFDSAILWSTTCGIAVGWIAAAVIFRTEITSASFENLWKYAIATPVTIIILAVALRLRWPMAVSALILVGIASGSALMNYRSHALVCAAAAVVTVVIGRRSEVRRNRLGSVILIGLALIPVAGIPYLMASGLFGSEVEAKTQAQSTGVMSIVFGGRTEVPLSAALVSQRPIIGWGNLEMIDSGAIAEGLSNAAQVGLTNQPQLLAIWLRNGDVNVHSALFNSWVEGGILAAAVFMWLLFAAIRAIVNPRVFPLLTIYLGFQTLWDTLFSPLVTAMLPIVAMSTIIFCWPRRAEDHRPLQSRMP